MNTFNVEFGLGSLMRHSLCNDVQKTKDMLIDRGKGFIEMAGVAHRTYAGLTAREPSVADFQEEVREANL